MLFLLKYPGSFNSLLQQAGRAGRGTKSDQPSFSVMICFNSPAEQYLWKYPHGLLSRGLNSPLVVPLDVPIVQGHLLCAASESPLTLSCSAPYLLDYEWGKECGLHCDQALFAEPEIYRRCIVNLNDKGCITEDKVFINPRKKINIYKSHASFDKPHILVSMRSIEPISYGIVDVNHPLQGGHMDYIRNEDAIFDKIPYSRVFYHAFILG